MSTEYDLVVIGSGPGGYVGAIRAAQLGVKTAVVERYKTFGGTCLNVGCIPSKALLDSSEHYSNIHHQFAEHGIKVENPTLDMAQMIKRKDKVVSDSTNGITYLFDKNKIDTFQGFGKITSPNTVEVKKEDGSKTPRPSSISAARPSSASPHGAASSGSSASMPSSASGSSQRIIGP